MAIQRWQNAQSDSGVCGIELNYVREYVVGNSRVAKLKILDYTNKHTAVGSLSAVKSVLPSHEIWEDYSLLAGSLPAKNSQWRWPVVAMEFILIHPFQEGNGRVGR